MGFFEDQANRMSSKITLFALIFCNFFPSVVFSFNPPKFRYCTQSWIANLGMYCTQSLGSIAHVPTYLAGAQENDADALIIEFQPNSIADGRNNARRRRITSVSSIILGVLYGSIVVPRPYARSIPVELIRFELRAWTSNSY